MRGVCWASGLDESLFRSQPLESGRAMVIYGESLMATKADNPTSTNGLGLHMSKELFRPLACCRVKSAYEYYLETRCTKP